MSEYTHLREENGVIKAIEDVRLDYEAAKENYDGEYESFDNWIEGMEWITDEEAAKYEELCDDTVYLMNVHTGSVDTKENWLSDLPFDNQGDNCGIVYTEEGFVNGYWELSDVGLVEVRASTAQEKEADINVGDWIEV